MSANEFAQAVADQVLADLRDERIQLPPDGATAMSFDADRQVCVIVSITPSSQPQRSTRQRNILKLRG